MVGDCEIGRYCGSGDLGIGAASSSRCNSFAVVVAFEFVAVVDVGRTGKSGWRRKGGTRDLVGVSKRGRGVLRRVLWRADNSRGRR